MKLISKNANAFLVLLPKGDLALFVADCLDGPDIRISSAACAIDWSAKPISIFCFCILSSDAAGVTVEHELVAVQGLPHEFDAVLALLGKVLLVLFDADSAVRMVYDFRYVSKAQMAIPVDNIGATTVQPWGADPLVTQSDIVATLDASRLALSTGNIVGAMHYTPLRLRNAQMSALANSPTFNMASIAQPLAILRRETLEDFLNIWNAKVQASEKGAATKTAIAQAIQTIRRKLYAHTIAGPKKR